VHYAARLEPLPATWRLTVPIIVTDGEAESLVRETAHALEVSYREDRFAVTARGFSFARTDEVNTNKNARYRTYLAEPDGAPGEILFRV